MAITNLAGNITPLGKVSTNLRDKFITLLDSNGFRQVENNGQGYRVFRMTINDWLWVRVYPDRYMVRLFADSESYTVRETYYTNEVRTQQAEGFMKNCILTNI